MIDIKLDMILTFSQKGIQVNVIMPAAKLRPAVVGCPSRNCRLHSPQLENVEPTTAGRSLATGKRKKINKAKHVFHTAFFPSF